MQLNLDTCITGGSEQNDSQIGGAVRKMITKEVKAALIQTFHQVIGEPLNSAAGSSSTGSEQVSNSDYAPISVDLGKMLEVIVIQTIRREIGGGLVKDLLRKFKEEIQSALEKILIGGKWNSEHEIDMSADRNLQLKFLNEVPVEVRTGKEIKGKQDTPLRVALVDPTTGLVVKTGPEASANVEICILESGYVNNEQELSVEDFNNRIITEKDKEKPHFTKRMYLHLKEGVAILSNVKLAQDSAWTRTCQCRLGARIENNFSGIKVKEAMTECFKVSDNRNNMYGKHYPPRLSDYVWRLKNIGKNGDPCKCLAKKNIWTVRDFLFLLHIDRQRLENIVGAGAKMKATVDHAQTCIIDDNKIYIHRPFSDLKNGVAFDVVGRLKGLIRDSCYIPVTNLSEDEKACADKLLLSAFENQKGGNHGISFEDEKSLLHQFPYKSNGVNAAVNCSSLDDPSGCDPRSFSLYYPSEPGTSSHSMNPSLGPNVLCRLGSPYSTEIGQLPHESNMGDYNDGLNSCFTVDDYEQIDIYQILKSPSPDCNNLYKILNSGSPSRQQSKTYSILVRSVGVMLWFFIRARKRVEALEDAHVPKRQKIV